MALPELKGRPLPSQRDLRAHSSPNVFDGRRAVPEELQEEMRAIARREYARTFGQQPVSQAGDAPSVMSSKTYPLD